MDTLHRAGTSLVDITNSAIMMRVLAQWKVPGHANQHHGTLSTSREISMSNQQQDAIFIRNFSLVLVGLAIVGIIISLMAKAVYKDYRATQDSPETIAARVAPVGSVNTSGGPITLPGTGPAAAVGTASTEAAAPAGGPGQQVYGKVCFACHGAGVAGAPKLGDAALWGPRIAKGIATLDQHALNGFQGEAGVMPPKGGMASLSDDEVKAAVQYMVDAASGGGSAAATEAPAAAPPAAAAPAPVVAAASSAAASDPAKGKQVYDGVCFACHTTGAAGAPKFGDKTAWAPRISKGTETLYEHALNGFMGEAGMMPPKGGRPDFTDDDVKAAVDYMIANER